MGSVGRSSDSSGDPGQTRDVGRWEFERALRGLPLPLTTRGVLFTLVSRMDVDGSTRRRPQVGSETQLAADLDVEPRVVKEHLRTVRRAGLVRREGKSYTGHVAPWILCLPAKVGTSDTSPSRSRQGTSDATPVEQEGTSPTSERGRVARQRGDVSQAPLETLETLQTSPPTPRDDAHVSTRREREERETSELVDWITQEEDGISHELAVEVVGRAEADPTTYSADARLRKDPNYRRQLVRAVRRDEQAEKTKSRECPHGKLDGLSVTGTGDNRSRICGKCEAESPAPEYDAARSA